MPSRPVLIGRGLVPTPYKTNHHNRLTVEEHDKTCATKHTRKCCPRPHAVPNQHTHRVRGCVNRQLNSTRHSLEHPHTTCVLGACVPPELRRP